MTPRITRFELDSGSAIEVEVYESDLGGRRTAEAGLAEDATRKLSESLEKMREVADAIVKKLRDTSPGEIEVSFGVKLSGTTNVIISAGSAEANVNVKVKWNQEKKEA